MSDLPPNASVYHWASAVVTDEWAQYCCL